MLPPCVGLLERGIAGVAADRSVRGSFCWLAFARNYFQTVSPPLLASIRLASSFLSPSGKQRRHQHILGMLLWFLKHLVMSAMEVIQPLCSLKIEEESKFRLHCFQNNPIVVPVCILAWVRSRRSVCRHLGLYSCEDLGDNLYPTLSILLRRLSFLMSSISLLVCIDSLWFNWSFD